MSDNTSPTSNAEPLLPWFKYSPPVATFARQATVHPSGVTLNHQLASLLFTDLGAELQGNLSLGAIVTATFELPAEVLGEDGFLGFTGDLRGSWWKSGRARATLIAELGGSIFTKEFLDDDNATETVPWSGRVFSFEQRVSRKNNPDVAPLPPFTVNILLSVQRLTADDSVIVSVDSLDLAAIRG